MKQDKNQRKAVASQRRPSAASAILSGRGRRGVSRGPAEVYTSYGWLLLLVTFLTIILISFLFTPYTHQLDEIKNVLLMFIPPFLLIAALAKMDFSAITWKNSGALILLGLYFASMCFSWVINPYKPMGETVVWFNLSVATFTVVLAWYMNTENKARKTMLFFVGLGMCSTLIGLFMYAKRYTQGLYRWLEDVQPWGTLFYTLTNSSTEMYSFILNSDFYAAFLVMLIPIALAMFFVEKRLGFKVFALVSFLLMNVCLVLTNSNDSFISMGVAYPFFIIMGVRYVKEWELSRQFKMGFALLIAAGLVFMAVFMLPRLSATYDFKAAAFSGRRVLWGGGFWPWIYGNHLDGSSPDWLSVIFGTGPGGYRHYFPWFRSPDFFDQQINNVTTFSHNFYLDTLLEQGLVGLVILMAFIVRVFGDGFNQIKTTTSRTHLFYQIGLLTGLLGIAVQCYSSPNNRWAVAGMMYWCLFGLSMGLSSLDKPRISGDNLGKKLGDVPLSLICKCACLALAVLFIGRQVMPSAQFSKYWQAAKLNANGLRYMDQTYSMTPEQSLPYLQASQQYFEKAIDLNPTFATSYYKLAHVYNQLGASVPAERDEYMTKAIQTYEKLDEICANYSEVQLNLGIMYAQKAGLLTEAVRGRQEKAQKLLQDMQTATGAKRQQMKEDYDALMEDLSKTVNNIPEERRALMETSYRRMKEAAHQSLKPNTQYLTGTIGRELLELYQEAGETEKANKLREEVKPFFRSLLNYKPRIPELQADQKESYPKAQMALLALAQETENVNEAIDVLKGMVHDNPDNQLMLKALLESFDKAGKTQEKLAYLEEMVHADPTDALLRLQLADSFKKAGNADKYLLELRKAEVLTPDDPKLLQEIYSVYKAENNAEAVTSYLDKLTSYGIAVTDLETSPVAVDTTASDEESSAVVAP